MYRLYEYLHECHDDRVDDKCSKDDCPQEDVKKLLSRGSDNARNPFLLDALAFMIAAEEDGSTSSLTVADSDDYEDDNDEDIPKQIYRGREEETSHHQLDENGKNEISREYNAESGMSLFPIGAKLGSVTNCWGVPDHTTFFIRGPEYCKNSKKIPSQEFLFPLRGVELLMTNSAAPTNVASNPALLQGRVRDVPTFVVNFRLPWGMLLVYHEIPAKFVPYLCACYETDHQDSEHSRCALEALLESGNDQMTPAERCVCRYLLGNDDYKNQRLKIVPHVVQGPWVARVACNGKPAILGRMLPIQYHYQPPEVDYQSTSFPINKELYLEADLDIASSSAARSILNIAKTYTKVLTLDLGFVIQGNEEDELPEQMLVGCRLHGVNPDTAPMYPYPAQDEAERDASIVIPS